MDNIIFDKVTIHNFLSIGDAEVDLSERGFVIVKGRNEESSTTQSNGSGKSTIFDSIFWTLTGETLRGASDIVNEKRVSDGCSCSLLFHNDTHTYRIDRFKSHSTYGNACHFYVDDELLSDQTKKSQEMIVSTIPSVASSEILGSIILLGQGLPYKFSSFSPSRRKDLLETMSGSSSEIGKVKYKLDIEESEHTRTLNDIKSDTMKNSGIITGLESTVATLSQQIESVSSPDTVSQMIDEKRGKIKFNSDIIHDLEIKLSESESRYNEVSSMIETINTQMTSYNTSYTMINSQLSSMKSGNCPTCGKPYDVTPESIAQKEMLEQKSQAFYKKIDELKGSLKTSKLELAQLTSDRMSLSGKISTLQYEIGTLNTEISNLERQRESVELLQSQLNESQTKIDSLKIKINDNSKIIDEEQEYLDCISYLKRQLSRDFKGYMLSEVIKFMSSRSEYYSDYLFTTGKKIEVTLSGNKILISVGGRLYENLSGGERQRVDLAVQFALRDMLVMTSGFSCNLLVLDEAFDNLDAQGSDALIKLIVSEFSDVDSVFVVTHHSEIDIPYDTEVTVVKNSEGVSQLEMSF